VSDQQRTERAHTVARFMVESGRTVGVAESLTGGRISATLAAAPEAGTWYRGGIVAYAEEVKRSLLSIPDCPVVSKACAQYLAANAARLLGADYSVAVTGEAGPQSQEDAKPGTVWLAVTGPEGNEAILANFDGEPEEIVDRTIDAALELLLDYVQASTPARK
jgi:nicotinamide-nucleotide amidase